MPWIVAGLGHVLQTALGGCPVLTRRPPWAVRSRMLSQASGELLAMVVLPFIAFGLGLAPVTAANLVGAASVVVLLAQGTAWWLVRWRSVRRPGSTIPGLHVFGWLRRANPVGLAVVLVVLSMAAITGEVDAVAAGLLSWVLAVLKHVNYFHRQVLIDNPHDLQWVWRHGAKRGVVARALDGGSATRRPTTANPAASTHAASDTSPTSPGAR